MRPRSRKPGSRRSIIREWPDDVLMTSYSVLGSAPQRTPSANASPIINRCAAAIIWFTILTTFPCPTAPTCTICLPIVSRSGRHCSRRSRAAADHDRQRALRRGRCAAAHRRVQHLASRGDDRLLDFLHADRGRGRHVDEHLAARQSAQKRRARRRPSPSAHDRPADRDDDVGGARHLRRRAEHRAPSAASASAGSRRR